MKLGEILREITNCDENILISEIADIMGENGIVLRYNDIKIDIEKFIC